MPSRLPRFIAIDGRRYCWSELVEMRRAQAIPKQEQPALFELREDHRPAGQRNAVGRYEAPSLFDAMEHVR